MLCLANVSYCVRGLKGWNLNEFGGLFKSLERPFGLVGEEAWDMLSELTPQRLKLQRFAKTSNPKNLQTMQTS